MESPVPQTHLALPCGSYHRQDHIWAVFPPLPCKCFWINQRAFPLCLEECWVRGVSDTKNYQTWPLSLRGKRLDGTGKQTIRDPLGGTLSGAGDKGNRITFIRPSAYSSVLPFISLDNKSWLSSHCAQDGSRGGFKDTEGNVISSFAAPHNLGETNSYGANRQYGTGDLTWVSGREYLPGSRTEPRPTGAPSRWGPRRSPRPTRGWEAQDLTWPSNAGPLCALDRSWAQAEGLAPAARCSLRLSVCLPHPSSSRRNCGGVTRTGVTGDRRRTSGDTGIRTAAWWVAKQPLHSRATFPPFQCTLEYSDSPQSAS